MSNYIRKLQRNMGRVAEMGPGFIRVDCYHDNWCAMYKGGECNCDPALKVRKSATVEEALAPPKNLDGSP